jgi:hypothetical protein
LIDIVESPIRYTLRGTGAAGRKASRATRLNAAVADERRESIGVGEK